MLHKLCGNSSGAVARNNLATMTKTPPSLDLPEISHTRLTGLLDFLQAAEQLKDTVRSGTTTGGRPESTAEHSWRLALMVLLFEPELKEIDLLKLLKLTLVHDLGEAISGDVPAPLQTPGDDRQERERRDFLTLCELLPGDVAGELTSLWDEYAAARTVEARLAKAFDKLETMLQHVLMPRQAPSFYEFNLGYGRDRTDCSALTRQLREEVDELTRTMMTGAGREIA
ncbi:HD domain-containing protein [Labrenzia sp. R5_0]|jgi:putative hydrolase of HD superfamily|uniref:HD domain-containing protein n=1 Tax=Labrenzia sp. R5_0 TaxID=2821108 RepID=UPI00336BB982